MKNISLLIGISLFSLHSIAQHRSKIDSANIKGEKFLGVWTDTGPKNWSNCSITRRGNEYTLQYINHSGIQALFYKLKGDSLVGIDRSYGNVVFVPESGHIKWIKGEWEKATGKQLEIGGRPLNRK